MTLSSSSMSRFILPWPCLHPHCLTSFCHDLVFILIVSLHSARCGFIVNHLVITPHMEQCPSCVCNTCPEFERPSPSAQCWSHFSDSDNGTPFFACATEPLLAVDRAHLVKSLVWSFDNKVSFPEFLLDFIRKWKYGNIWRNVHRWSSKIPSRWILMKRRSIQTCPYTATSIRGLCLSL